MEQVAHIFSYPYRSLPHLSSSVTSTSTIYLHPLLIFVMFPYFFAVMHQVDRTILRPALRRPAEGDGYRDDGRGHHHEYPGRSDQLLRIVRWTAYPCLLLSQSITNRISSVRSGTDSNLSCQYHGTLTLYLQYY